MNTTQEAFDTALADIFEGREAQLGHGPRKLLRELYERALQDARGENSKVGQLVARFADLQVGDVIQNPYLASQRRCRRVVRILDACTVETEFVSTRSKRIVKTEPFDEQYFKSYQNYRYISDPDRP